MTPRAQIYQPNVNPMIVFKYGTEEFQITQNPIKATVVKCQDKFGLR